LTDQNCPLSPESTAILASARGINALIRRVLPKPWHPHRHPTPTVFALPNKELGKRTPFWANSRVVALQVHCKFSPLEKARVNVSALLVALGIKLFYSVLGGISRSSHRIYCGLGNHSVVLASNSLRKRDILGGVPPKSQICVMLFVAYRYPSPTRRA